MSAKISAVIFDYGNVLCPMPPPPAFESMAEIAGIPSPRFVETLWQYRLDFDRGTLNAVAYWQKLAEVNGKHFSNGHILRLMRADFELWIHLRPEMLTWARTLRASGIKTAILSNMPREFAKYLRENEDWLNDFDVKVLSGELGIIKPEGRIYQVCLDGLGLPAEETLFIDDMAANVDAARAMGINAIKFESVAQLVRDVAQFELPAQLFEWEESASDGG